MIPIRSEGKKKFTVKSSAESRVSNPCPKFPDFRERFIKRWQQKDGRSLQRTLSTPRLCVICSVSTEHILVARTQEWCSGGRHEITHYPGLVGKVHHAFFLELSQTYWQRTFDNLASPHWQRVHFSSVCGARPG
jgi:hypothetical protein